MAETHVSITVDKSGSAVKFDSPGVAAGPVGAGQAITQVKDGSGKPVSTSGQVPNTSVVFNSPG